MLTEDQSGSAVGAVEHIANCQADRLSNGTLPRYEVMGRVDFLGICTFPTITKNAPRASPWCGVSAIGRERSMALAEHGQILAAASPSPVSALTCQLQHPRGYNASSEASPSTSARCKAVTEAVRGPAPGVTGMPTTTTVRSLRKDEGTTPSDQLVGVGISNSK